MHCFNVDGRPACRRWNPTIAALVAIASSAACSSSNSSTNAPGVAELSDVRIDFGQADCGGAAPASKSVTITNTGSGELAYGVTLHSTHGFAVEGASGRTLDAGDSAQITVVAPSVPNTEAAGRTFTGVLLVTTGVSNAPTFSVPITMQAAGAVFQIAPGVADFGVFPIGNQAPDIKVAVTNVGNKAATVAFSTPAATDFTVDATPKTISPGSTEVATTFHFTPTTPHPQQTLSKLVVQGGVCAGTVATLPVKGQGTRGAIGVSPGTVDFGLTDCGTIGTPQTFIVANTGSNTATWSASLGQGNDRFTLSATGGLLLPNTTDKITVTPKPVPAVSTTAVNGMGDVLTVTTDIPGDTAKTVNLQQTARGAVLAFTTTTLTFPTTVAGGTSAPSLELDIVNSGNAVAHVTALHASPDLIAFHNAASFRFPATPIVVPAGATSPLPVTFDPVAIGDSTSHVLIGTSDALCGALPTIPVTLTGDSTMLVGLTQASVGGGRRNNRLYPSQCARLSSGRVACWGRNDYGQLGIGSFGGTRAMPQIVRELADVTAVASHAGSSFALTSAGRVLAWGRNDRSQLGDGTTNHRSLPVDLGLTGVVQIDADHQQACALTTSSTVLCWGSRQRNRRGTWEVVPTRVMPAPTGTTYTEIAVAGATVCALRDDGQIDCQGGNLRGQLGNNTTVEFNAAVTRVSNVTTATQIDGGAGSGRGGFFCALLQDGTVQCWGDLNRSKNGASNSSGGSTRVPVAIPGLSNITQISVGSQHACALRETTSSAVLCWGNNSAGQVGVATSSAQVPVQVAGLTDPTEVVAGGQRSCAMTTDGFLCWGDGIGWTPHQQPGF